MNQLIIKKADYLHLPDVVQTDPNPNRQAPRPAVLTRTRI